jgi:hypothetical protein
LFRRRQPADDWTTNWQCDVEAPLPNCVAIVTS